jgi:hypothetical protein
MGPLPQPPDLHMPGGAQTFFFFALLLPMLGLGAYAVRLWRREDDPVPVLCVLGGLVCTVFEPIVDVLGLCWYPRHGQMKLFETFGRPIPVPVLFGYAWAMGGMTVVALRLIRRHGVEALFRFYPLLLLVTVPFELIANNTHFYVYYGNQPLRLFEWPVWWAPVNMAVPVVAAVLITRLRPYLTGARVALVAALVVFADGGVNAAVAWPVWSALNAPDLPTPIVQLAGVATIALAFLVVWLVTRPVHARDQLEPMLVKEVVRT